MKRAFLSSLLLVILSNLFGYNYLTVGDPRNSWWTDQGTIEEATLSVRPKGMYMEYGLYLTFSTRGTNWVNKEDTVEVTLMFDLPEGAILHDSWLWIGDAIVRAEIMDKWSASAIYENIVKRRRDPSILRKQSATQYELRVFPMAGNETRKVKITYLMPVSFNKSNISAAIPTEILNTSRIKPDHLSVFAWNEQLFDNPRIVNDDEIIFTAESDTAFGNYYKAIMPSSKFNYGTSIGYDSHVQNGYYFSKYQKGDEGIYQLAVFPGDFTEVVEHKKTAILVDYDASNSNINVGILLNTLKSEMLINLNSADSFNLFFSNLSIVQYSDKWIAASKENIETAFGSLTNPLSSYSNLPSLLGSGINFVKNHGNDGKIILVSNSGQFGDFQTANTLIKDLVALMNPKMQIHISDFQTNNLWYYNINGRVYYGNEYFYSNLSKITLGSFHRVGNDLSFQKIISEAFKYIGGSIKSFDLHTSLASGFCFGRYTSSGAGNIAYINDAILQVGKFKGDFPFTFEISGEYNNKIFSRQVEVQDPGTESTDSIFEEIWAGQYIRELELAQQSNDIINEVIFNSLSERVLSLYTAFLCLEEPYQICYDCEDESDLLDIEDFTLDRDSVLVYPNPFTDKLTIELICSEPGEVKELAVYNITGSLLYRFNTNDLVKGENTLTWDGQTANGEAINPGIYILVYKTSSEVKSVKIAKS